VVLFSCAPVGWGGEGSSGSAKAAPTHILFLAADGFRTDYVEWYNPPTLKKLISEGVRVTHAKNVFPTVTTPNMASLVTGAYPRTTGIACNTQYVKEQGKIVRRILDVDRLAIDWQPVKIEQDSSA